MFTLAKCMGGAGKRWLYLPSPRAPAARCREMEGTARRKHSPARLERGGGGDMARRRRITALPAPVLFLASLEGATVCNLRIGRSAAVYLFARPSCCTLLKDGGGERSCVERDVSRTFEKTRWWASRPHCLMSHQGLLLLSSSLPSNAHISQRDPFHVASWSRQLSPGHDKAHKDVVEARYQSRQRRNDARNDHQRQAVIEGRLSGCLQSLDERGSLLSSRVRWFGAATLY